MISFIPKVGTERISFGTSKEELIRVLGNPINEKTISDMDGYAKSRYNLYYEDIDFLWTPELGVIAIGVNTEQLQVALWGTQINNMSTNALIEFLTIKGCETQLTESNGWDEQDVISYSHGLIASFCEDKLEY